jgi:Protein of unknown function (DUF3313)
MKTTKCITRGSLVLLAGTAIAISLVGCKTKAAHKQVFIPKEYSKLMTNKPNTQMGKSWGKQEKVRQYDKIQVAVVISKKQLKVSSWFNSNASQKNLEKLAEYAAKSFKKSFEKSKKIQLVSKPGPKTMVLEFAIVQAIPNKPVLGAISNMTNLIPMGILMSPIKLSIKGSSEGSGVLAMEVILRDSESGEVLAVIADRVKSKTAYFNTKDFTKYGSARQTVDMWTKEIATSLDHIRNGQKINIKKRSTFSFFN